MHVKCVYKITINEVQHSAVFATPDVNAHCALGNALFIPIDYIHNIVASTQEGDTRVQVSFETAANDGAEKSPMSHLCVGSFLLLTKKDIDVLTKKPIVATKKETHAHNCRVRATIENFAIKMSNQLKKCPSNTTQKELTHAWWLMWEKHESIIKNMLPGWHGFLVYKLHHLDPILPRKCWIESVESTLNG